MAALEQPLKQLVQILEIRIIKTRNTTTKIVSNINCTLCGISVILVVSEALFEHYYVQTDSQTTMGKTHVY